MDQHSDAYFISRVVLFNDQKAFEQLVKRYQKDVRSLLLRLTAGDHHKTDDLAQETFIRAYTYLRSFKAKARFSTWLLRIAYNIFLDSVKKEKRRKNTKLYPHQKSINPESGMDAQLDYTELMKILRPPERAAIHLAYISGMSHGDISKIMACPVGTVKSHISRGKNRIRTYLKLEL